MPGVADRSLLKRKRFHEAFRIPSNITLFVGTLYNLVIL
jgi:hypothetical protein